MCEIENKKGEVNNKGDKSSETLDFVCYLFHNRLSVISMSVEDNVIKRKIVIVGDGACGKTSLLYVFTLGEFPTEYHPTVFENYATDCRVDGKPVRLTLWDTAGQEEYERLRPLSYSKAHIILVAFALDSPDSLENAAVKWAQEVRKYCARAPIVLVGLKKDLRPVDDGSDPDYRSKYVLREQGERVAQHIGAKKYIECSSLTGEAVDDVFEVATRASLVAMARENTNGNGGPGGSGGGPNNGCCVIS